MEHIQETTLYYHLSFIYIMKTWLLHVHKVQTHNIMIGLCKSFPYEYRTFYLCYTETFSVYCSSEKSNKNKRQNGNVYKRAHTVLPLSFVYIDM